MKDSKKWLQRLKARRDGSLRVIDRTEVPEGKCSQCGKTDELRPYGPGYSWVCFDCAMKDEPGAAQRMREIVFGETTH